MSEHRQYVGVKFKSSQTRVYTFHNDGDPVEAGDRVEVRSGASGSIKRVDVVSVSDEKPPYATKPILGKAPPPTPEAA